MFKVPLNLIIELNQVKNITELFNKFMPDVNMHEAQYRIATTGFQSSKSINQFDVLLELLISIK
jgi:hypothetical protein